MKAQIVAYFIVEHRIDNKHGKILEEDGRYMSIALKSIVWPMCSVLSIIFRIVLALVVVLMRKTRQKCSEGKSRRRTPGLLRPV